MKTIDLWQTERQSAKQEGSLLILRGDEPLITVKIWQGKQTKPFAHYHFKSIERREAYIQEQIENEKKLQEMKTARKASKIPTQEQIDSVKVGDIFEWSWGYDQTNLDYYQVVAKKGRTVTLREIAQEAVHDTQGFMCENRIPVPANYIGDPFQKVLQFSSGKPYLAQEFGWCGLWSGTPHYCSWYA